ncbi:MAG: YsnF/AvaK domain-containing protein [Phycisphaeraceae bacterium]
MIQPDTIRIIGKDGLRGHAPRGPWLETLQGDVPVTLDDGRQLTVAADALETLEDGSLAMPIGPADIEAHHGTTGADEQVIPLAEEQLRISRKAVPTGKVIVEKTVHEWEEVVDEPTLHEDVEVKRFPIGEYVEETLPIRQEGDTTIVPLYEEVVVVKKRLRLKEEVHITRRQRREHREPQRVVLRREEASIHRENEENTDEGSTGPGPSI